MGAGARADRGKTRKRAPRVVWTAGTVDRKSVLQGQIRLSRRLDVLSRRS